MDGFPHNVTMLAPGQTPDGLPGERLLGEMMLGTSRVMQHTLKAPIDCVGTALHSGARVAMSLRPAPVGQGIVFRRRDLGIDLPARFDLVADTRLCTVLADPASGARVATVEHVMAALSATGITNAVVELDGPELPILDGSAANIVFLIDCAGIAAQDAVHTALAVVRPVRAEGPDGAWIELLPPAPGMAGLAAEIAIDFAAPAIGAQSLALHVTAASFRHDLAAARTFCLLAEVEAMQEAGLARGGSLDNAVVVDGDRILNPGGLRMDREFVRHKLLDIVGDLALAGATLHATLRANRPGHALNNAVLRRLFAEPANWRQLDGATPFDAGPTPRAGHG